MENQHRKIKGYRELSEDEITLMNEVKELGPKISAVIEKLNNIPDIDKKWLENGKKGLQIGVMCLIRSITRPDFF